MAKLVAIYDGQAMDQNVNLPSGGRSLTMDIPDDTPCDRWCRARFGFVELLVFNIGATMIFSFGMSDLTDAENLGLCGAYCDAALTREA
jgi:hypothetical protein